MSRDRFEKHGTQGSYYLWTGVRDIYCLKFQNKCEWSGRDHLIGGRVWVCMDGAKDMGGPWTRGRVRADEMEGSAGDHTERWHEWSDWRARDAHMG